MITPEVEGQIQSGEYKNALIMGIEVGLLFPFSCCCPSQRSSQLSQYQSFRPEP